MPLYLIRVIINEMFNLGYTSFEATDLETLVFTKKGLKYTSFFIDLDQKQIIITRITEEKKIVKDSFVFSEKYLFTIKTQIKKSIQLIDETLKKA
jgi:hypothetical protein